MELLSADPFPQIQLNAYTALSEEAGEGFRSVFSLSCNITLSYRVALVQF